MNIINLPPVLPGELDLRDLNLQLQTGEATLDWSNVQDAPQSALARLLAGLDIVEQSEELGLGTVPDALAEAVLRVLSRQNNTRARQRRGQQTTASTSPPATWELEQQSELHVAAVPVNESLATVAMPASLPASPRSVLQPPAPSVLRDELERLVLQDLLGPAGGPEEELEEGSVRDRYLVGMLAPRDQQIMPEEMDELAIPEEGSSEDGPNDDTALQTASLCPSSLGMSFCVDGAASQLRVTARWGYYRRVHSETLKTPKGAAKTVWKRQAMGSEPHIFLLREGPLKPWSPEPEEQPDVVVREIVRRTQDFWTVTLFLVNEQREPEKRRDEAWVFQPELSVEAPDLVCVLFDWARPRDLSHYEQFEHYHATFYQQVEALSVMPFAPRAIDRGLAALLVSYVRLLGPEFNENGQAGKFMEMHPYVLATIDEISRRTVTVTGSEEVGEAVQKALGIQELLIIPDSW